MVQNILANLRMDNMMGLESCSFLQAVYIWDNRNKARNTVLEFLSFLMAIDMKANIQMIVGMVKELRNI